MSKVRVIIHGGAGRAMKDVTQMQLVDNGLAKILGDVRHAVEDGLSAMEGVLLGCKLLEDSPLYNAGTGSVIQSDGQIRMSASIMSGARQAFSGVINVQHVKNPIEMAEVLQHRRDRVLASEGAFQLARELNIPYYNPMTDRRFKAWVSEHELGFIATGADVVAQEQPRGTGTIGVVILDLEGNLAVGTSTGGRGFEYVGRVSDSATPAGNYANDHAAVSCTGIGEDILDASLASRIVVRATDGMSLLAAFEKSFRESEALNHDLAAIGIARDGSIVFGKTGDILLAYLYDGHAQYHTLNMPVGYVVQQHISSASA